MTLKGLILSKVRNIKELIHHKKTLIFVIMIIIFASLFRFAGVGDGRPYVNYHADEGFILYEGLRQIPIPHLTDNLIYPAFSKYTFAFLISPYIAYMVTPDLIQIIKKSNITSLKKKTFSKENLKKIGKQILSLKVKILENENLSNILILGRAIFVFFGIFLLLVCFKISNIFEENKALALLFYLGFCPAFVITGWYLLPGMERLFFEYLAILSLFYFVKAENKKYLIYFAILTGIAMSCKYSSYYLYIFFPYIYFKYLRGKIDFLILLLILPVATFFLTTPEAFFHLGRLVDTLEHYNNIYLSSDRSIINKIIWLRGLPQYFIGWPLLIAGLVGFVLSLRKIKSSFTQILAIYFLSRSFISLVLQSSYRIYYRNEIELALILLIYASFFTSKISTVTEKIVKKRWINFKTNYAYFFIISLLTVSPLIKTLGVAKMVSTQKETRVQAGEYIQKIQKECSSCKVLVSKELDILPLYFNDKTMVVSQQDILEISKKQPFDFIVTPTYLDWGKEKVDVKKMGKVVFLIDRMSKDWKYRDLMNKILGVYEGGEKGPLKPSWSGYDVNPTIAVVKPI